MTQTMKQKLSPKLMHEVVCRSRDTHRTCLMLESDRAMRKLAELLSENRRTVAVVKWFKWVVSDKFNIARLDDAYASIDRKEGNFYGWLGEVAFATAFGFAVPRINIVGDKGIDFWLNDYTTIDVKWTTFKHGQECLYIDHDKAKGTHKFNADYVILCTSREGRDDVVEFLGWISKEEFEEQSTPWVNGNEKRNKDKLIMYATSLRPMSEFRPFLEKCRSTKAKV